MKTKHSSIFSDKSVMNCLRPVAARLLFILALSPVPFALSQIPQGFNYQAVARDPLTGFSITGSPMKVQLTIQTDSFPGPGTILWQETHNVTTNSFGLINVIIGKGTRVSGAASFSQIDWTSWPNYFIKTEIEYPLGSPPYKLMGISRLWSVPYAMIANDFDGPVKKLAVKGETASLDEALFEVKNKDGQTIFAVYNEGVRIYVDDGNKSNKGGFSVGGFGTDKAGESQKYLVVTDDSTRIYVNDQAKASKGGFAVGGFGTDKSDSNSFLQLNPDNYFIGQGAGFSNTAGKYNSFIGYKAGYSNTEGELNSFIGYYSGYSNITGYSNIFIGDSAGYYNTEGRYNIFIGNETGLENTSGFQNIYLGEWAGYSNTTGNRNIIIGTAAAWQNTEGNNNVFIGNYAGAANTKGSLNVMIGRVAGYKNTEGIGNTFLGEGAGLNNSTGNNNVYVGLDAGRNADGYNNVFIGNSAGYNEAGSNKLYIDNSAADSTGALIYGEFDNHLLLLNGDVSISGKLNLKGAGNDNLFLGDSAGFFNAGGTSNTFIGTGSGLTNIGGNLNVFLGAWAGTYNISGSNNTFLGRTAGVSNQDGLENTFVGASAGYYNVSGSQNVALGRQAGVNSQGDRNIFIGYKSGQTENGSDKLYIENSNADNGHALIYGDFDKDYLKLNALTSIRDALILEPRSSAPDPPAAGMIYFDSRDNMLKVYDGSTWRSLW